jgi:membrane protein
VHKVIQFLKIGIWRITRGDVSSLRYLGVEILKKVLLAVRFFTAKRVMTKASALTYSTLLAIVPILAVVFAIARGFGYNKYIEV